MYIRLADPSLPICGSSNVIQMHTFAVEDLEEMVSQARCRM
jgi:hypothetical protein